MTQIEYTDTFGGEANYCWVKRWKCAAELSDRQAVRLAKKLAGLTGHPCRVEDWGGDIAIYPRGICQVIFVTYAETGYAQGMEVDAKGEELATV